jgi:hypothetical protein
LPNNSHSSSHGIRIQCFGHQREAHHSTCQVEPRVAEPICAREHFPFASCKSSCPNSLGQRGSGSERRRITMASHVQVLTFGAAPRSAFSSIPQYPQSTRSGPQRVSPGACSCSRNGLRLTMNTGTTAAVIALATIRLHSWKPSHRRLREPDSRRTWLRVIIAVVVQRCGSRTAARASQIALSLSLRAAPSSRKEMQFVASMLTKSPDQATRPFRQLRSGRRLQSSAT